MFRFFYGLLILPTLINAQLSGTLTIPGSYSTLAAGLSALNNQGISGPLTLMIASNYTETAPAGGFSIYVSGTAQWPVLITGNAAGPKPLFLASAGSRTSGSVIQDGLLRLIGCDYITIAGLAFRETQTSAPQTMEFAIGIFKNTAGDACHHLTIRDCDILLNYQNNSSGNLPACDGSRGIEMINALASAHTSPLTITSASGAHHHNSFYGNRIMNCNYGIALIGFADASPFTCSDTENQIGGLLAANGNTIINFGGGGSNPSAGIRAQQQQSLSVFNNLLISNNGSGGNHPGSLRGIQINMSPEANTCIQMNTVTLHGGGTTAQLIGIENQSGSGGANNSVNISNNLICDGTYVSATTGNFYGISNSASSASLIISNNTFRGISTHAFAGSTFLVYNTGLVSSLQEYSGNSFSFEFDGNQIYTGFMAMVNTTSALPSTTIRINNNRFNNLVHRRQTGSGLLHFISVDGDAAELEINNNLWKNIHLNHSGPQYGINNSASTGSLLTVHSNTLNNYNRMHPGNFYFYYGNSIGGPGSVHTFSRNLLQGYSSGGSLAGNFTGIQDTEGSVPPYPEKIVSSNTVTGIDLGGSGDLTAIQLSDLNASQQPQIVSNLIRNLSGVNQITGILITTPFFSLANVSVCQNTIAGLNSLSAGGTVNGLVLASGGLGVTAYKNKISGLQSATTTGSVNGIYLNSAGNYTLHTNCISDLNASNAVGINRVNGILAATGNFIKLYYNTVRLAAQTTSTLFGSNAFFCSATPSLDLRNNILINLSAASGSGQTVAYRRSTTSSANYLPSSNCNIFYAGAPSVNNLLVAAGTSAYQTITSLQSAFAPRESLSYSQNQQFASVNAASSLFLHLASSQSAPAESSALGLAGITDDVDNELRQGNAGYTGSGTGPDIGADEVASNSLPCATAYTPAINGPSEICQGEGGHWFSAMANSGTGINFQWKVATTAAGPFLPLAGMNAHDLDYTWLAPGQFFLRLETSCPSVSLSAVSASYKVNVFPIPQTTLSAPPLVCAGTSFSITATGNASEYYWKGPAAFTSGSPIALVSNADSFSSGIYTLQTWLSGCAAAVQTLAVTVVEVQATVSAEPAAICTGANCTVTVNGNASLYLWNGTPGASSIVISPPQTSVYTLQAIGFGSCSISRGFTISVVTPTIAAIDASLCLPASSGTAGVRCFTPSVINWFSPSQMLSPVGSGTSINVTSGTGPLLAKASLMQVRQLLNAPLGQGLGSSLIFDLLPTTTILLKNFELAFSTNNSCIVSLYRRSGSFQGFTNSASGWNLVAAGVINTPIPGQLTSCNFSLTQFCAANQITALCLSVSGNSLLLSPAVSSVGLGNGELSLSNALSGPLFNVTPIVQQFEGRIVYSKEICSSPFTTVQVLSGSAPLLTVSPASLTICPSSVATLSAAGAASYLWSTGSTFSVLTLSPLQNQTLVLTGKSPLGCPQTTSVPVQIRTLTPPMLVATSTLVCPQQTVQLSASGAMSYTWAHGPNNASVAVTVNAPGTYKVFGTDTAGCVTHTSLELSTRPVPLISISVSPSVHCAGELIQLNAEGALTYTWLPGGAVSASIQVFATNTSLYNAIGRSVNTCTGLGFLELNPSICAGSEVALPAIGSILYPHPAQMFFRIKTLVQLSGVIVRNVCGQLIHEDRRQQSDYFIDCSSWPRGYYLVVLQSGMGSRMLPLLLY